MLQRESRDPGVVRRDRQRQPIPGSAVQDLKYRPDFPARFGSIQDVRAHCHVFFPWYNVEHHHSGLGLLTPHDVHFGLADQRVATRATVLATAYAVHPERFPRGLPQPPARLEAVWINPPKSPATEETRGPTPTRGGVLDHARPGQVFSAHRSDLDRRGCLEAPA
jgi:integrase-like protein